MEWRPAFPREPDKTFSPFILDATNNIQVPAPINVFLREYQGEGIQFLYDRFKEGHGGVLGDDMGLVRDLLMRIMFPLFIKPPFLSI